MELEIGWVNTYCGDISPPSSVLAAPWINLFSNSNSLISHRTPSKIGFSDIMKLGHPTCLAFLNTTSSLSVLHLLFHNQEFLACTRIMNQISVCLQCPAFSTLWQHCKIGKGSPLSWMFSVGCCHLPYEFPGLSMTWQICFCLVLLCYL